MVWVALAVTVGAALWTYFNMPKVPKVSQRPGEVQAPICEDGAHIPVVFGTVCLKGPNVTWWGDVATEFWKPSATIKTNGGTSYRITMRMRLCHGSLDAVLQTYVNGTSLIHEPVGRNRTLQINKPHFFANGEVGHLKGLVHFRMGYPTIFTGNNTGVYSPISEAAGEPGGFGPGFYGVAAAELEQMWLGPSPNLAPWAFVVQRIMIANGLESGIADQWYKEKAYIPHGVSGESKWYYKYGSGLTLPSGDMEDWLEANRPDDGSWEQKAWLLPFGTGTAPDGLPSVIMSDTDYGWPSGKHLWTKTTISTDSTDVATLQRAYLFVYCENAAWAWIDDQYIGATNGTNAAVNGSSANFDVTDILRTPGNHEIVLYCLDENPADNDPGSTYVYARVVTSPVVDNNVDAATLYSYRDMNPSHIIRECLTDPVWGMGYTAGDIDDDSFTAAADTLYQERFGLSIAWDKPGSIEDFINEILRHINGTLYIDRLTGKYTLTLIREGYDVSSLVSLGATDIEKLEDVSRRAVGDLTNQVTVSYTSSIMGDSATVTITEQGLVQLQGAVINTKIDYLAIKTHELASRVALRELRALSTPLLSCTVIASRKAASLNPGEPFLLTRAEYGLNQTPMRVLSIELGDGRTNRVRIKCIEDVFASPEDNVLAPPPNPWTEPTATPIAVPDPIFVDTYQYKSTFMPAKLGDRAVHQTVDAVFCMMVGASGGLLASIFDQATVNAWEEIRPGVWRARILGQGAIEGYIEGVTPFAGMRLLAAFVMHAEYPGADLPAEDKPRQGIYVLTNPGFNWNEETRTYTSTYAQLERAQDFTTGEDIADGCIVRIANGNINGGKWARLTTTGAIEIGTTDLEFERLDSYSPIRGDNLLTEAQTATMGDGEGDTLNLSATAAEPGVWVTFPTVAGTPNAQTYPAGRTRWKVWCYLLSGDPEETTTIECQIVKYIAIDNVTVLAEAETDLINGGSAVFPLYLTTHADVNNDQTLGGAKLAVRYRLTTTSATQVVVRFRYGDMLYQTRVDTPLTIGEVTGGFPSTPYGDTIALDGEGILVIPDRSKCSGEVRVSGSTFNGIQITDAIGAGFVGGDKLGIRLTENCTVYHDETVRAGAAGLNLSTSGGLTGDDVDKPCGPRSQIILQYDDLVGQWEVVGTPTVMDQT
jgi:hypothetical protein